MPVVHNTVRVWDPLVRLFHWCLVACFAVAYLSGDEWLSLHVIAGYTILGLVTFRCIWGVIGTQHARFTDFVHRPATVVAYFRRVLTFRASRYLGHNPAGGAMVITLLCVLSLTVISGLVLYGYQEYSGPFAALLFNAPDSLKGTLKAIHEFFVNFTLLLVALHLAGVVLASLQHGENLVRSMFTGRKQEELPS